jgi:hypothetical protein
MPIRQFLNGEKFDCETTRVLGLAFEVVCAALRVENCADDVKQAIADKIIVLAKGGELRPDALCEQVLKDLRAQPDVQDARKLVPVLGPTPVAKS